MDDIAGVSRCFSHWMNNTATVNRHRFLFLFNINPCLSILFVAFRNFSFSFSLSSITVTGTASDLSATFNVNNCYIFLHENIIIIMAPRFIWHITCNHKLHRKQREYSKLKVRQRIQIVWVLFRFLHHTRDTVHMVINPPLLWCHLSCMASFLHLKGCLIALALMNIEQRNTF